MLKVCILSRGAGKQQYGLGQDARLIQSVLNDCTVYNEDPYKFMGVNNVDVNIHLEVPCRAAFPWAKVNVIIPNPEWWFKDEWAWVRKEKSVVFFHKSVHSHGLFPGLSFHVGWAFTGQTVDSVKAKVDQAVFIVGGSKHKKAAADIIVKNWKPEYNKLIILSSAEGESKPNVQWITNYISNQEKTNLLVQSKYHIVASLAEGFGYTMAESIKCGAKIIWTGIPVFKEFWGQLLGTNGMIEMHSTSADSVMLDKPMTFNSEDLFNAMLNINKQSYSGADNYINSMNRKFHRDFSVAWGFVKRKVSEIAVVPVITGDEVVVGVITLIYNRPHWFKNALLNISSSSYNHKKMVWVLVDDSNSELRIERYLDKAKQKCPDLTIKYVCLEKKTTVGQKRNYGCLAAIEANPDVSAFAFMDDDDHYPSDSIGKRVSNLGGSVDAVYCSTLPMYDTCKYISAMNVPPLDLAPCKRVSEATLCFKRSFWEERNFESVDIAEGEQFLKQRESHTMELNPTGIIVSFIHNRNLTSRRVPESKEPNGCHYGFSDTYFTLISELGSF